MRKVSVIVKSVDEAFNIKDLVDAYMLPLKDLSINYQGTFSLEDIKIIKSIGKEVFVFINKNIHNDELELLKNMMIEVDKIGVDGIIFYDASIVKLKEDLSLKTDLVFNQEHMANGYGVINYWYNKGVKYTYLSSEITKREINEIRENTKAKLFVNVFGYIPMFTSRRHLVDNYLNTFNLKDKGNKLFKEGKTYNIYDSENGTTVYSDYILNVKEKIEADYLVYNSNMIDDFEDILKNNNLKEENGFLYQETIYKVK